MVRPLGGMRVRVRMVATASHGTVKSTDRPFLIRRPDSLTMCGCTYWLAWIPSIQLKL